MAITIPTASLPTFKVSGRYTLSPPNKGNCLRFIRTTCNACSMVDKSGVKTIASAPCSRACSNACIGLKLGLAISKAVITSPPSPLKAVVNSVCKELLYSLVLLKKTTAFFKFNVFKRYRAKVLPAKRSLGTVLKIKSPALEISVAVLVGEIKTNFPAS